MIGEPPAYNAGAVRTRRWPRRIAAYPCGVSLYTLAGPGSPGDPGDLIAPTLIGAFDGWVDAGNAATAALAELVADAPVVATFDADALFDYRARRPTLPDRRWPPRRAFLARAHDPANDRR